jgi:RNA polymerase sigma-70 factor (ECF subfamily)
VPTIGDHIELIDFTDIYEMFYRKVYAIALRISRDVYLAEDIIQETFIKAYKKLDTIVDPKKMGPWLSAIASHTAIDFMRKGKRKNETLTDYNTFNLAENEWSKNRYQLKESEHFTEQEILEKLDCLKQSDRSIFSLKYEEGLKEEEIASKLDISRAAVKSRLYRARQSVKMKLIEAKSN